MEADEIDKLSDDLNAMLRSQSSDSLIQFFEDHLKIKISEDIDLEDMNDERAVKIWKDLMSKIERGDYNHFLQLIKNNHSHLILLMKFSSKSEDIKSLVEDSDKLGIPEYEVLDLIKATHDVEYIKSYIRDREKFGIAHYDVIDLIKSTHDSNYIKSCIEDRKNLRLSPTEVGDLIEATHDVEYIKSCISDRKEYGMPLHNIVQLIKSTQDSEYIKKCIKENSKDLGLPLYEIVDLIKTTKDSEYIKECIADKEKFRLLPNDIIELIKSTQDNDYIKECVKNRTKLNLSKYYIVDLIKTTKDQEYIKKCIENTVELGLLNYGIVDLIKATQDMEYVKKCIVDRKKIGIGQKGVIDLIKFTQDKEYIKKCITDMEFIREDKSTTVELILASGDINFIQDCENSLDLEQKDIEKLRMFTTESKINLPPNMTIGIEIETEGKENDNSELIKNSLRDTSWKAKGDGSLVNGTEVVSPILTSKDGNVSNEIKSVCAILNGIPQIISERCGGHIHIGADYLTDKQDWINLIGIWTSSEKVLYTICNKEGDIPREGVPRYAQPISKKIEGAMESGTINLDGEEDLLKFANEVVQIQGSRYSGINFCNVGKYGKNTVEFRLPNGTINPNTWIENINLFGGIVKSAHELTMIQSKSEEQRTDSEKKVLDDFEILQTEEDENQIAKALIELCIPLEDRHIYMDRYRTNTPLLDASQDIKNAITDQISTNKIGKKLFTGKNAVKGEDYEQSSAIIEQALNEHDINYEMEQGG